MTIYAKILNRISILFLTNTPQDELDFLIKLQIETCPELSETEAFDYVIYGIIKLYEDTTLDYLWNNYSNQTLSSTSIAA